MLLTECAMMAMHEKVLFSLGWLERTPSSSPPPLLLLTFAPTTSAEAQTTAELGRLGAAASDPAGFQRRDPSLPPPRHRRPSTRFLYTRLTRSEASAASRSTLMLCWKRSWQSPCIRVTSPLRTVKKILRGSGAWMTASSVIPSETAQPPPPYRVAKSGANRQFLNFSKPRACG